jgi:hypothetical protein
MVTLPRSYLEAAAAGSATGGWTWPMPPPATAPKA